MVHKRWKREEHQREDEAQRQQEEAAQQRRQEQAQKRAERRKARQEATQPDDGFEFTNNRNTRKIQEEQSLDMSESPDAVTESDIKLL